jgi:lipopolysaccharide export system protein LptA
MRFLSIVLAVCAFFVPAETGRGQQHKIIELRSADTLKGRTIDNEEVRELIGHVHFVQITESGGVVRVWCDRALRYMTQNKVELFGNVRVVQDSVTIRSNEGVYYGDRRLMVGRNGVRLERGKTLLTAQRGEYLVDEKRSHFTGNVVLVDTSSTITCNELTYFEPETRSISTGDVHVFEYENAVNIYGDSLVHIEQRKYSLVPKNPRLVKIDTSADGVIDTMVVVSKIMQTFQDSVERFIAIDSVQMARSDLAARCGMATYFVKNDCIALQTHPIIWSGENQITGDSMIVQMKDKRLRSLWVKNRAMAISRADSVRPDRFNQLTGRELTMYFRANKLEQADVQRTATSLYYLYDRHEPNGANKSSGDRIFIDFAEGVIDRIRIIGGVQGQYLPEKMILKHEAEYNLEGFRWYENRPERVQCNIVSSSQ